jgi:hypothetical protein
VARTLSRPDFIVVGAAKSGTTSFFQYMGQHPEIYLSPEKEPHFFALGGAMPTFSGPGDDWFTRHSVADRSAYQSLFEKAPSAALCGEASPLYLYHPRAPGAIRRMCPSVRLIALLRDPAERAFSQYLHMVRHNREPLPTFTHALAAAPERSRAGWEWYWQYLDFGFYAHQLQRYLRRFDRRQIRIYLYDDFCSKPASVLKDAFYFLGVDPTFDPQRIRRHSVTGRPYSDWLNRILYQSEHTIRQLLHPVGKLLPLEAKRRLMRWLKHRNLQRPSLAPAVRQHLIDRYRSDILALQALLDRDLSSWLSV